MLNGESRATGNIHSMPDDSTSEYSVLEDLGSCLSCKANLNCKKKPKWKKKERAVRETIS